MDGEEHTNEPGRVLLKPRVHMQLLKYLASQIINGAYPPGSVLPPEPALCASQGVSRSAVREAVKVLGGKGLVTTRPRIGTVVRPKEDWSLLDPDILAWTMELMPQSGLISSLMETRQTVEPAAARFAAQRASLMEIARIEEAHKGMVRSTEAGDQDGLLQADIAFHTALIMASHNIIFQQLCSMIEAALAYSFSLSAANAHDPSATLNIHGEIVERICLRDEEGAYQATVRLLEIAAFDLGLRGG